MAEGPTVSQIEWNGDEFMADLRDSIQDGLEAVGVTMQAQYQSVLRLQSSNKTNGGSPSQPGQPPAQDSGNLLRSITYKVGKGNVRIGVASGEPPNEYALALEYGTRKKVVDKNGVARQMNLAARPWLRPTLRKNYGKIDKVFSDTLKSQMSEWLN